MDSNILSFALPIGALLIAIIATLGLWLWWSGRQDTEDSDNVSLEAAGQPRVVETRQPLTGSKPKKTEIIAKDDDGVVEVMRVLRDLTYGSLIIEIDGQQYHALHEIKDAQVGRRFIKNASAVAKFARISELSVPDEASIVEADLAPPTAPTVSPALESTTSLDDYLFPDTDSPVEDIDTIVPKRAKISDLPPLEFPNIATQKMGLFKRDKRDESDNADLVEPPPMIGQIEALLQHRLSQTNQFPGRDIHILPAYSGIGLKIIIDGNHFEAVGDITNSEVREFIQETIRMWEERQ